MLPHHGVLAQNDPTFTSTPPAGITYGATYDYTITVNDLDGDDLEVVLQSGPLPAGISLIDNLDGTYNLNGTPSESGTFPIILEVREVLNNANNEPQAFNIEIAKAPLNVIADDQTITYGDAIPTLTFSYNSADFVNSETDAVIDVDPDISTTATIVSDAGTYPITLADGSDDNYSFIFTQATLEITQASQTITFTDPADKTYGDADFDLVASSDSGLPVDFSIVSGPATLSGSTVTITGAGTVVVEATQAGNINYTAATPVQQSFEVAKAPLNVIADDQTITYGDAIPTLTFSYQPSDFVNSETDAVVDVDPDISTTATAGSDVGTYPITLADGSDDNYSFIFTQANLEITQASQTISFTDPADKTYGDADFDLVASSDSGLPVSFSIISGPATISGSTVTITGAGTVVVEATQAGNINYTAATPVQQSFEVAKAPLNVIADDQTITYGDALPTLTFSFNAADFVNSETEAVIDVDPDISTTATAGSDVGNYPITLADGSDDNYSFIFTQATLEITPANQTITFTDPADKTYGDADFDLVASSDSGLPVSFSIISGPATLSGSTVTITGAGTLVVEATQAGDVNYTAATPVQQSFEIAEAPLNVIADDQTITYGDAIPTLTFSFNATDFVNSETEAVIDVDPDISTTATAGSDVGTYPIVLADGSDDNYSFIFTQATLEITQASQTITFTDPADKTYGDADFDLVASSDAGLPVSFSIISGPATLSGSTVTIIGAGTVVVEATQAGDVNYTAATPVQQSFEVAKAPLNVIADDQTITYGDAIPTLTFSFNAADFVNSETEAVIDVDPDISTTATIASDAGTYPITLADGSDDNYTFLFTDATLEITQASQTITFTDPTDKTYGDADFDLVASSDAGLPVDFSIISGSATLSGSTVTIIGAGTVVVEATQAGDVNYTAATPVQQSFEVAKAPLNVIADDQTITYGDAIPTLTFSYQSSDFVNSETAAVIDVDPDITTTATIASDAGTYPITLADGNDDNYTFLFTDATLEITQASQTITFTDPTDKTYGDADFDLVASSDAGLPVSFSIISGPATLTGSIVTITGAGTVVVEATQAGNINYTAATPEQQSFEVAKAPLNVIADDQTITYGDAIPALTFSFNATDFVNSETQAVIDVDPNISTTATIVSNAGTYPITLADGNDDNYTFLFTDATLEITQASQTITFTDPADKTYGDADFNLVASSDSGLPVSFSIISGPATLSGSTVTITGAGTVVVEATQAGNINYTAATPVQQSFEVGNATASITFTQLLKNFNGSPKSADFTTTPEGLNTIVTYNSSSTIPTNPGSYDIEVTIDESNYEGTASATFVINGAPNVTAIGPFNYNEDESPISNILLLNYFSDVEDSPSQLNFSLIGRTNSSLYNSFTLAGNQISFSLAANAFGSSTITIRCTDSNGLSTDQSFTINVGPVQDDPLFTSTPQISVNEDFTYQYNITATDADPSDELSISNQLALPAWLSLTYNGDGTALLTGTPNNNQVGNYGVALEVNDGNGNTAQQLFNIEVINTNDEPIITSTPVLTASLNTLYSYTFTASDVDLGDELTTTVNQKPSWITATETEPGKLVLSGTPTNSDREESTDVSITVSDLADAETTQNFTISVNFPNSAPVFISSPVQEVNEDEQYAYNIAIDDLDNDTYTVEALLLPSWLNFSENNNNYSLQGRPLNEHVGSHQVILRVEDQLGANTTQNYTVEVINLNDTPVFVTTPILEAQQNNTYNLPLEVLDVDANEELTFSFIQQPNWLTINASNTLTGTPNREDVENSPHVVEIKVEDNAGASDTLSFSIEVKYENSAPTLDPVPELIELTEDDLAIKAIQLTGITAGEENNQSISISIDNSNEALFESFSLNYTSPQSTAEISYQLKADAFGEAVINITVTDDGAEDINAVSDSFTIAVEGVNDAPVFNSNPVVKAQSNTAYTYNIEVDDDDPADLLTISQVVGPSWLSVTNQNNRSAVLTGMVPETATSEQITLRVTDESGEFAEQAFTIQINTQPVINNYEVELNEDEAFILNSDLLNTLYSDEDDDPFTKIILNWGAGSITSNGVEITKGQELDISEGVALTYKAPDNYSGTQTISYIVSDPFIFSEEAIITLTFLPVNDAPTITNIESETLEYVQGSSPIQITSSITISDIDDQMIDSAWVKVSSSYNQSEDELILETDAEVTSRFERNSGTLLITGQLSKSEYEIILSEVAYFNSNELTDDTTLKSISFQISDGDSLSNVLSRSLVISEVLPELEIYTAFTPNGDGINDTWRFPNIDQFEDVHVKISDLNGREIFNCRGQACEWDGVYNGEVLPAGTYFYNVSLNGGRRKYDGTVTIIK